jgi:hypothetical protein
MFIRKIIHTDGSESNLDGIRSITEIADMLFADSLHLVDLDDRIHIMLFNEVAYFLKLPINIKATEIFNQKNPLKHHTIQGDVAILPSQDLEHSGVGG